jgi:hypothetical protein
MCEWKEIFQVRERISMVCLEMSKIERDMNKSIKLQYNFQRERYEHPFPPSLFIHQEFFITQKKIVVIAICSSNSRKSIIIINVEDTDKKINHKNKL